MAEAFALAAGVIAVIQMTDRISNICKHYIESVKDCPSQLRVILVEVSMLKTLLENLQIFHNSNAMSDIITSLSKPDGPVEGCKKSIVALEKLFPDESSKTQNIQRGSEKKRKLTATVSALAWPLKEKRAQKLLEEIRQYKATISLALTTESVYVCHLIDTAVLLIIQYSRDIKDVKTNMRLHSQSIEDVKTDISEIHSVFTGRRCNNYT